MMQLSTAFLPLQIPDCTSGGDMASISREAAGGIFFKRPPCFQLLSSPCRGWNSSRSVRSRPPSWQAAPIQSASRDTAGGGELPYKALLLDVGGTLLEPAEPVPDVYARVGRRYGVTKSADEIKKGFKEAFAEPWPGRIRYEGDGRPFWRFAVKIATGSSNVAYFEELYNHYSRGRAWKVAGGFREGLIHLRHAGVKLAVVSNFDVRLRPILQELQVHSLFDVVIVSAEVGFEKPSPQIFEAALEQLQCKHHQVVHVGDDATADKAGAEAIGIHAWLWKVDVRAFPEIINRILKPSTPGA